MGDDEMRLVFQHAGTRTGKIRYREEIIAPDDMLFAQGLASFGAGPTTDDTYRSKPSDQLVLASKGRLELCGDSVEAISPRIVWGSVIGATGLLVAIVATLLER